MMRWSEEKLLEYQSRQKNIKINNDFEADDEKESALDSKIIKYCKEHSYYYFHDYSRGINKRGHPDFIIAMPRGRVIFIENKSKNGKLRPEQQQTMLRLLSLGCEFYECRSFKQFLQIILKGE